MNSVSEAHAAGNLSRGHPSPKGCSHILGAHLGPLTTELTDDRACGPAYGGASRGQMDPGALKAGDHEGLVQIPVVMKKDTHDRIFRIPSAGDLTHSRAC